MHGVIELAGNYRFFTARGKSADSSLRSQKEFLLTTLP